MLGGVDQEWGVVGSAMGGVGSCWVGHGIQNPNGGWKRGRSLDEIVGLPYFCSPVKNNANMHCYIWYNFRHTFATCANIRTYLLLHFVLYLL